MQFFYSPELAAQHASKKTITATQLCATHTFGVNEPLRAVYAIRADTRTSARTRGYARPCTVDERLMHLYPTAFMC